MIVVAAPDKFAGTLSAAQAAEAVADGWSRARPDDDVRTLPMADGGAGTLEVVARAVPTAQRHTVEVADARGRAVEASWLTLPDGGALICSAEAIGLERLPPAERNPRLGTSYGVGQLVCEALHAGADEIIVTLGGSATCDGGAGLAIALGHRLLRPDGNGVKVGAEFLEDVARIVARPALPVAVTAAVDVDAPLLGTHGALAFAAQKGAADADLPVLEAVLRRLADVVERDLPGGPWRDLPGAGAAGGAGFGLAAFAGARLTSGAQLVGDIVGLAGAVAGADVVVTGEGALDRWSGRGKVPGAVVAAAREAGARVVAITGRDDGSANLRLDDVRVLGEEGLRDPAGAVARAAADLAAAAGS